MFLAFRQHGGGDELLPAQQVLIGDWESRDFGGNVFLAPDDNIIESKCVSSDARYRFIHLCHRNVP